MSRGVQHDADLKASVLGALLTGGSLDKVAAQFSLPESTVKTWKQQLDSVTSAGDEPVRPQKEKTDYAALVGRYLEEALLTLAEQQKYFRTAEWLKRQPASEVAVLHGVTADKVIRILEAIERGNAA